MVCYLLVFLGLAVILLVTLDNLNESYKEQNEILMKKENVARNIEKNCSSVFLDIRGFLAFGNEEMKERALEKEPEIRKQITMLRDLAIDEDDRKFAVFAEDFVDYYFDDTLPDVIANYEDNNMKAILDKANNESIQKLAEFQGKLEEYLETKDKDLHSKLNHFTKMEKYIQVGFIFFMLVSLLTLERIIRHMLTEIGKPLSELAKASNETAMGREAVLHLEIGREDEIGVLSSAFQRMLLSIQEKENELVSHNEELLAQGEELQKQQIQLESALESLEERQRSLNGRNELIHQISDTLEEQKVLENAVNFMAKAIGADCGLISLVEKDLHANYAVPEDAVRPYLKQIKQSEFVARLQKEQHAFIVSRKPGLSVKGMHQGSFFLHHVYVPVFLTEGSLYAIMLFCRYCSSFEQKDLDEYEALAKSIGNILDKVRFYQKTEEERKLNQEVINTVQEGLQLIDANGKLLKINAALCEVFECKQYIAELEGVSSERWAPYMKNMIEDGEAFIDYLEKVLDGSGDSEGFVYSMKDSGQVFKVYSEELSLGVELNGMILVHRNITKEYEVDKMKSEFVSTVSHELRTPLSSILGFSELMLYRDLSPEKHKNYTKTIYQETQRLASLINDFLDVQKMEAGKQQYRMDYVKVYALLERVVSLQKLSAPEHCITIEMVSKNEKVFGDEQKLEQAIRNLVSNSVKYSPGGGPVSISCYREGEWLKLAVKDQGLGIPKESLDKLFTKFYRVDNSDRRKIGGTGLGLSIVQEVVKAHSGNVTVESEYGHGSTFTISIPVVEYNNCTEKETVDT
ncbi:ATP-binding protein [Bacillus massilinigeriensis]|uniref:ATP-binding protein n=1 Tax=Bacillus mediterraneensis TaxID=1805474 RepID=UPI000B2265C9|nr:ATP-binding protein [Bacillus mediterraneensis]